MDIMGKNETKDDGTQEEKSFLLRKIRQSAKAYGNCSNAYEKTISEDMKKARFHFRQRWPGNGITAQRNDNSD